MGFMLERKVQLAGIVFCCVYSCTRVFRFVYLIILSNLNSCSCMKRSLTHGTTLVYVQAPKRVKIKVA